MNLERFIVPQDTSYQKALEEVQNGKKVSHWMWYIFPQYIGLGESDISIYFSIKSKDEAEKYLEHEVLGMRLREITEALLELDGNDAVSIFGSIDAMKLKSSMTLFDVVSPHDIFESVLNKYYQGEKDDLTLQLLGVKNNKLMK